MYDWLIDWAIGNMSKKSFPNVPAEWNFSPAPSVSTNAPLMANDIYPHLESGFAEPVSTVRKITGPKTVELQDGRLLTDIDAIVFCTGYDIEVPFLPPEFDPYPIVGEPPVLYRHMFPLSSDPKVRNSLAFVGLCAVTFPGYAKFEAQAMAISQIWLGNSSLPPLSKMKQWHSDYLTWRSDLLTRHHRASSSFHTLFLPMGDFLRWVDETAGIGLFANFGWFSARAWALWWKDRELYNMALTGLFSPAIWRLFDMGKRKPWVGAREQIFRDNAEAKEQRRRRQESMKLKEKEEEEKEEEEKEEGQKEKVKKEK